MRQIYLRNIDDYAMVDDEDFEWLDEYNWYGYHDGRRIYVKCSNYDGAQVQMHRIVTRAKKGQIVAFRDLNSLNCQKSNLMIVKSREKIGGLRSRHSTTKTVTRYKGVHYRESEDIYIASIRCNGKVHKRIFHDALTAAQYYDYWARKCWGPDANRNFPDEIIKHEPAVPKRRVRGSSPYRGVYWKSQIQRWIVEIHRVTDGENVIYYGGVFSEDHEYFAALAADKIMRSLKMNVKQLNYPEITNYRAVEQRRKKKTDPKPKIKT